MARRASIALLAGGAVALGMAGVAVWYLARRPPGQSTVAGGAVTLSGDVARESDWGPSWRSTRPPGLVAGAPRPGVAGSAEGPIRMLAPYFAPDGADPDRFAAALIELARGESNARVDLPANTYDSRPVSQRPTGKPLITAYGAMQWNGPAWRSSRARAHGATGDLPELVPWPERLAVQASLYGEVYGAAARVVGDAWGPWSIRLWHRAPAVWADWITLIEEGFDPREAAIAVASDHAPKIDRQLAGDLPWAARVLGASPASSSRLVGQLELNSYPSPVVELAAASPAWPELEELGPAQAA